MPATQGQPLGNMNKSRKQTNHVFQWFDAPYLSLLKLVQEAADSTCQPTPSLVLAARSTLSIVDAVQVQAAKDVEPDFQLLAHHAITVVGLLCRVYMIDAGGQDWHTEVDQILVGLIVLLPKILKHVKSVRFLNSFRTRGYLEEIQSSTIKVAALVTSYPICFERSAAGPESPVEREETAAPRPEVTGKGSAQADGTCASTSIDQADPRFTPPPIHAEASRQHPAGYPLSPFPLLSYDATHPYPSIPSMPQAFPTSGGIYFGPYVPPAPILWNNNCGNSQNINITNQYFGTSGRRSTRRRESSVRDQVRMAQDIIQTISPPYLNIPPPPAVVNYPPYGVHPFMPGPPMQSSAPLASGPHPASPFLPSLSNLDTRTVSNLSTMNATPNSHNDLSSSGV